MGGQPPKPPGPRCARSERREGLIRDDEMQTIVLLRHQLMEDGHGTGHFLRRTLFEPIRGQNPNPCCKTAPLNETKMLASQQINVMQGHYSDTFGNNM